MNQYFVTIFVIWAIAFGPCTEKKEVQNQKLLKSVITIGNQQISLNQIDSLISPQLFELRMNALEIFISQKVMESEARNQKITIEKLVEKEIIRKSRTASIEEIINYFKESAKADTSGAIQYITNLHRKERQVRYIDSLKEVYAVKISLQPSYFKNVNTADIYSHNITENNSTTEVYIISDFKCPSCQEAEKKLRVLYSKYEKRVHFKFVYFSGYIDRDVLACEAAAMQGKFREMHDVIFDTSDSLGKPEIYNNLARSIGVKAQQFNKAMQNKEILKKLLKNKDLLVLKQIYSTPTFIVNSKVLEGKYSIDYLEDVIINELNRKM